MAKENYKAERTRRLRRDERERCLRVVSLFRSGANMSKVARELGCSEQVVRRWVEMVGSAKDEVFRGANAPGTIHATSPKAQQDLPSEDDLKVWLRGLT